MIKSIATTVLAAGLVLGGAGVAAAQDTETPTTPATGSASGSAELLSNDAVQAALLSLILASGSAIAGANAG